MNYQSLALRSGKSGRDDYADKYVNNLQFQSEWLRRGAKQKADAIQFLMRQNQIQPASILELGCGTGAVVGELHERELAEEYFGLDFSADAIKLMAKAYPAINGRVGDVTVNPNPFDRDSFDLLVLSHTVEHLEQPDIFLQSIHQLAFDHMIVEVPLEDLFFGKLKSVFTDRSSNSAGHVQFFNLNSFRALIKDAGFKIVDEHLYAPIMSADTLSFAYRSKGLHKWLYKSLTERYLPTFLGPLWTHLYHAHFAILCKK